MCVYPNVTEEDLISLKKLAEQQKNKKARKIKRRIFKQTYDTKLAETFEPITKKIYEVVKTTNELEPSNVVNTFVLEAPPSVKITQELFSTLGAMATSNNKFKIVQDNKGRAYFNGVLINPLGGNDVKIGNNIYELTPEIQKALLQTDYKFDKMSDNDILVFNQIIKEIKYDSKTDRKSKRREYIRDELPSRVRNILEPPIATIASGESDEYESIGSDIDGNGVKKRIIVVPEGSDEIWTKLQVLLGFKLSGHTDTLIEASQLIDALFKKGEIETDQQYRNAINKFKTQ